MNTLSKYLTKYLLLALLHLSFITRLAQAVDYQVAHQPTAIECALQLPQEGILKQKTNGFVYLDVSNEFIKNIVPLLNHSGELRTPPMAKNSVGAHISVFHENEQITPKELGEKFSFQVVEIRNFTLHTRDGLKKLWVMAVHSPELEQLRQRYNCSAKLKGYDFHISLAKQMPTAPENWEKITAISHHVLATSHTEGLYTSGDFVPIEDKTILSLLTSEEGMGQLCLKNNGYVYLKVNNLFIEKIVKHLPTTQPFIPVNTKPKSIGAHITVMLEDEMIGNEIWELQEAGTWFAFEVKELRYVERKTAKGKSRLWLLAADVPGLERLRRSYGLAPKVKNHDFHITLGSELLEQPYLQSPSL